VSLLSGVIAYIGPALAEALAAVGSVIGTQRAASSGVSIISEDPKMRVRAYVLAALPMTQTIAYGFVYMLLSYSSYLPQIANKYGGMDAIPLGVGLAILGLSLFVGIAEMLSAYYQGVVCRDGIISLIKTQGRILTDAIVLAAYEELYGIIGMAFGIAVLSVIAGWPV